MFVKCIGHLKSDEKQQKTKKFFFILDIKTDRRKTIELAQSV